MERGVLAIDAFLQVYLAGRAPDPRLVAAAAASAEFLSTLALQLLRSAPAKGDLDVYRAVARAAFRGGAQPTARERDVLAAVAGALGLSAQDTERIDRESSPANARRPR